jgi:hypothetical protein
MREGFRVQALCCRDFGTDEHKARHSPKDWISGLTGETFWLSMMWSWDIQLSDKADIRSCSDSQIFAFDAWEESYDILNGRV